MQNPHLNQHGRFIILHIDNRPRIFQLGPQILSKRLKSRLNFLTLPQNVPLNKRQNQSQQLLNSLLQHLLNLATAYFKQWKSHTFW